MTSPAAARRAWTSCAPGTRCWRPGGHRTAVRRAEMPWVVGLPWQGQGYATEAARALVGWLDACGVGVIQAHIHPEHAASAAVAHRAGLRPSGMVEEGEQLWLRDRPAAP